MSTPLKSVIEAMTTRVLRAVRSPLNTSLWSCELECGHELWLTRDAKPKSAICPHCHIAGCK